MHSTEQKTYKEASLGKRYGFKLISNIATIPLFFLLESILPRALGPVLYGQYNFTFAFFAQVSAIFDPGISDCARTYLSRRPHEIERIQFFAKIYFFVGSFFLLTALVFLTPYLRKVFLPDIPAWIILPVAALCLCTMVAGLGRGLNDALGVSDVSEKVRIVVNLCSALLILFLFLNDWLSLSVFLVSQSATYLLLAVGFIYVFKAQWNLRFKSHQKDRKAADENKRKKALSAQYSKEFIDYCRPLVAIAVFTAVAAVSERWILQFFGGSVSQAYFSLSQKISTGCFLFVTAMIPLLMREMAMAYEKKDMLALARIIDKYAPLLYAVVAWFCCFTAIEAGGVIAIFGGEEFKDALLAVQIMAFYPLHLTYFQVSRSVLLSTNKTKNLRTISLLGLFAGVLTTWVFVAPTAYLGFGLNATGLALKMVMVQFCVVLALLLYCRSFVPFSLKRNLAHQIACPLLFVGMAFLSQYSSLFIVGSSNSIMRFFISGIIYTGYSALAVLLIPASIGFSRGELNGYLKRVFLYFKRLAGLS